MPKGHRQLLGHNLDEMCVREKTEFSPVDLNCSVLSSLLEWSTAHLVYSYRPDSDEIW